MTKRTLCIYLFLCASIWISHGQEASYFATELMLGISAPSNKNFPSRNLQSQFHLQYNWLNDDSSEWSARLENPITSLSIGYTNFGNNQELGGALTALAMIEFYNFNSTKWTTQLGIGSSYFTKRFDRELNPTNRAVSTPFTWTAKIFSYYTFLKKPRIQYAIGLGIIHHSNGHTKLPNQGYNSFLLGIVTRFQNQTLEVNSDTGYRYPNSRRTYLNLEIGLGQNVFSDVYPFNERKTVYGFTMEYGWEINHLFRWGIGGFYRFYEHYYDYINENEFLVQEGREFNYLRDKPALNAAAFGLYLKGEIILNRIGIELRLGANIHKPAYKVDWRINEGWEYAPRVQPGYWVYGEFDTKFRLKHLIAGRLGIKYYVTNRMSDSQHQCYIGAFINSNLGQADFTEVVAGYTYRLMGAPSKRVSSN